MTLSTSTRRPRPRRVRRSSIHLARPGPSSAFILLVPLAIAMMAGWLAYSVPYHFDEVQSGVLYRSGNDSLRRLKIAIEQGHIHTLVALVNDQEFADPKKPQFAEEKAYADRHGIKYLRIPVPSAAGRVASSFGSF